MRILYDYAMSFVGQPYRWGGDDPIHGYDCSGLVQEILESCGVDPKGDQTAQGLYDYFEKRGHWNRIMLGALAFFGKDAKHITHVGFCLDPYRMIEAGGGGSKTKTREDAAKSNAYVRVRPLDSRKDLVAIIRPSYHTIRVY